VAWGIRSNRERHLRSEYGGHRDYGHNGLLFLPATGVLNKGSSYTFAVIAFPAGFTFTLGTFLLK